MLHSKHNLSCLIITAATQAQNITSILMTVGPTFRRYKTMYLLSVSSRFFLLSLTQLNEIVAEYLLAVTHLLDTLEPLVFAVLRSEVVE